VITVTPEASEAMASWNSSAISGVVPTT
jgi:hypothetical protein